MVKRFILSVVLISAISSPSHSQNCNEFFGQNPPTNFEQVWSSVSAIPHEKEEFETTPQFNERRSSAIESLPSAFAFWVELDSEDIYYNADSQRLNVPRNSIGSFVSRSQYNSTLNWDSELWDYEDRFGSHLGIGAYRHSEFVSEYQAENAFGTSIQVSRFEAEIGAVLERLSMESLFKFEDEDPSSETYDALSAPMEPSQARLMKSEVRAAIYYIPTEPYAGQGTSRHRPTFDEPFDIHTELRLLHGDIQCVGLFDRLGRLLADARTN